VTLALEEGPGWVRFEVRVAPRAARESITVHGTALKIALHAPPVDGEANEALVALVASRLGIGRRDVRIVRGERGRTKILEVRAPADAVRALATR